MRYAVLGPIEVRDGDVVRRVGGTQQQRLLAALLTDPGRVIAIGRLVDVVWPDGLAPHAAERSVRKYVHRLRAAIGSDEIATEGTGYVLRPGALDAAEFEELVGRARRTTLDAAVAIYDRALALWRGSAYAPFGEEWWALPVASRLDELRLSATEERASALLATGGAARAVPDLQTLVNVHRLRERPVVLLASALYASGRSAEALRAINGFRSRLADETGLEPSPDVVELERTIAAGGGPSTNSWPLRGYVLEGLAGEGASARVYAAVQPGTNRRVALKVIRGEVADSEEFVRRFEAEARMVARLEHPHIVPLYDFWREPGGVYLAFRFLPRTADATLVTGGPWSVGRVNDVVEQVGGALLSAHIAGVSHGDITGSNVLLDDAGLAYLADFGLANGACPPLLEDRIQQDIADFARLIWKLFVGSNPPRGARPLPPLAERVDGVPPGVDALLAAATAAAPEFGSMAELILSWRAAVSSTGATVSPLPGWSGSESARRLAARQLIAATSAGRNPYLGLRSFDEADAGRFFGRAAAVDALHAVVRERRLVTVVGPSGSGKSSTVAAGLMPVLRAEGWRIVTVTPGEQPLNALRDALVEVAVEPLPEDGLLAALASVAGSARSPFVVVVDQAEECWTMAPAAERDEFLGALAAATTFPGQVHVVLAVRADFYGLPLQHPEIGPMVAEGSFPLAPMSAAELEDAIILPAAGAGVVFDDGVAAALVAEAAAFPASLPMLQFTLAELYEKRVDGRITAAALAALGGISGAVGKRAEEVYAGLGDATQPSVREVFARLVTPGEGVADTRRRARVGELSSSGRTAVDQFVAARLLVTDNDMSTREPVVEVAHEALLVRWPRLHQWVEDDRQWLTQLQHLAGATRSWEGAGRPESELYRGARLEAALEALPEHEHELTVSEIDYVQAGREARDAGRQRERRSARRLRFLLAAVVVALVASLIAGSIAVVQSRRAQDRTTDARRKALIAAADSLRGSQRDLAVLLAAEADRLHPGAETRSALFGSFTDSIGLLGYRWFDPGVAPAVDIATIDDETVAVLDANLALWFVSVEAEADGSSRLLDALGGGTGLVATNGSRSVLAVYRQSSEQSARLATFDLGTHRQLNEVEVAPARTSIAVSPDGTYVALAGGPDGGAEVWHVAEGRRIGSVTTPELDKLPGVGHSAAVAFSAADVLLVGTVDGDVEVHHLPDLDLTARLPPLDGAKGPPTDGLLVLAGGDAVVGYGGINGADNPVGSSVSRWDLPSGSGTWTSDQHSSSCRDLVEVPVTNELWCGLTGAARAIDAQTGEVRGQFLTQQGEVSALAVLTDGRRVIGASASFTVMAVLDGAGGGPLTTVGAATSRDLAPGAYRADGRYLFAQNRPNIPRDVALIDVRTGEVSDGLEHFLFASWTGNTELGYIGDDATGGSYDPATRVAEPFDFPPLDGTIDGVTNDPANNRAVLWMTDGRSFILDLNDRTVSPAPFPLGVPPDLGSSASFSPDGSRLAVIQTAGLELLDTTSGTNLATPVEGYHTVVAGADVVVAGDVPGRIYLLDPHTLRPTRPPFNEGAGRVDQLELSGDGRLLMARGSDVRLYDLDAGAQLGGPIPVALEGRWTGGSALRPDGLQLAVPNPYGIALWNLDPSAWHTAACQLAGRNLTKQEWDRYLAGLAPYHATCPEFASG